MGFCFFIAIKKDIRAFSENHNIKKKLRTCHERIKHRTNQSR